MQGGAAWICGCPIPPWLCFPGSCPPDSFSSEIYCSKQNGSDICFLLPFPTPPLALHWFQQGCRLLLISRWIWERNLIISDLGIHMCLSTTCHASCQLVTTSQEEFKVLIYLLLEMSLGKKEDTWRRERRTQLRQERTATLQGRTSVLVGLLICCCSADWTGRMINEMWNNWRWNGQETFISMKENGEGCCQIWWVAVEQKEKGKNKKVRYLIPIFYLRVNSSLILELKDFQTQRTSVCSSHTVLESDVSVWSSVFHVSCSITSLQNE